MKKSIFSILLLLFAVVVQAQIQEPVKFKSELKTSQAGEAEVVFTGTIDKGWHVYSTDLGDGGPISATFNVESISGAELVGKLKPVGKEVAAFDKLFEMKVRYFENTAQFVQKLKLTGGEYKVEGFLEYGACNDDRTTIIIPFSTIFLNITPLTLMFLFLLNLCLCHSCI